MLLRRQASIHVVYVKKGAGNNSILCTKCNKWIHKRCNKIKERIETNVDFQCPRCSVCVKDTKNVVYDKRNLVLLKGVEFECADRFCYLGDMVSAGDDADLASQTRVRCAWIKFRELATILTARGASLKFKGKIYTMCVQSVMVYGSETWGPMKVEDIL